MVLINIGTNKKTTSCLITTIDPRDGAAVIGANGVGKTTTLRLIPLFFGHLPSQIVAAGKGQEAMLRFVLPTAQSAIVFEYQRGPSDEHDIRTAVIRRRQDGTDAPEYRFFNSGFKVELFKGEDGIFLDDEQSTKAALIQQISFTQKLNGADYRSVILGLRALSKDALKLRRLAGDYAFGPKPLPNMDRLVAAMVKDHINFTDLIQVAVGMVQEELGTGTAADRGNLKLKQSKGVLAQWIIDREMCAQSINLRPRSDKLNERVSTYAQQEVFLRTTRVNVQALLRHRTAEVLGLIAKLTEIEEQRAGARIVEKNALNTLNADLKDAREISSAALIKYEEEKGKSEHFKKQDAAGWASQLSSLPALEINQLAIGEQIATFDAEAGVIEREYSTRVSTVEVQSAQECQRLEQTKAEPRRQHDRAIEDIRDREREENRQLAAKEQSANEKLENQIHKLITEKVTAKMRAQSPTVSPETSVSLGQANDRLQQHAREAKDAARLQGVLKDQYQQGKLLFDRMEITLAAAIERVSASKIELLTAEQMNAPAAGTLLATLREHPDQNWSRNLARVIDVDLLQRQDLQPHFDNSGDEGNLYGWHLDVGVLGVPDWTRDGFGKQQIVERKAAVSAAETHEKQVRIDLANASKGLNDAQEKLNAQTAQVSMFEMQDEALSNAKAVAQERFSEETKAIVSAANKMLERLNKEEQQLENQKRESRLEFASERAAIGKRATTEVGYLVTSLNAALAAIDQQIRIVEEDLAARRESLQQDRTRALEEKGIDSIKLDRLKIERDVIVGKINDVQKREVLISSYLQWLEDGGPSAVSKAENAKTNAKQVLSQYEEQKELLIATHNDAEELYESLRRAKRDSKANVESEVDSLQRLDEKLGRFAAIGSVTVDLNADSRALIGQINEGLTKLYDLEKELRDEARWLKSELSIKEGAVKSFIDISLGDINENNPVELATKLHWCQQRMGQQVIQNVNLTLESVLATISLFHRDITAFESEIGRFNTKLQTALSAVTQFERIKDVQIHITSNFEKVDFIRKLEAINVYARDYRAQLGRDRANTVPAEDIVSLLRDFMSVIGGDGSLEINLASHVTLHGSVVENGSLKSFKRESELEHVSSNGLTSIIMITLLSGLLNMIRGTERVHVAWVTDEVGKFDGPNFIALMQLLKDNLIDVVTASPDISPLHYKRFANRYQLDDGGIIRMCVPKAAKIELEGAPS
ncbi:ATP-binding protein [Herminiimonas contaminans]|uniref:ATP-binding protein n=1 Tax=Herminiimonas contaminans TaxID=1111140 RepID=A0ABS0EU82_9BURK|nr:ATP-binding protein [Herminiimonas contaminans]MBF8178391.1 ATP-binding protein [Herminiimonas contaminans]